MSWQCDMLNRYDRIRGAAIDVVESLVPNCTRIVLIMTIDIIDHACRTAFAEKELELYWDQ